MELRTQGRAAGLEAPPGPLPGAGLEGPSREDGRWTPQQGPPQAQVSGLRSHRTRLSDEATITTRAFIPGEDKELHSPGIFTWGWGPHRLNLKVREKRRGSCCVTTSFDQAST